MWTTGKVMKQRWVILRPKVPSAISGNMGSTRGSPCPALDNWGLRTWSGNRRTFRAGEKLRKTHKSLHNREGAFERPRATEAHFHRLAANAEAFSNFAMITALPNRRRNASCWLGGSSLMAVCTALIRSSLSSWAIDCGQVGLLAHIHQGLASMRLAFLLA